MTQLSLYEQLKFFNKTQEQFARDLGVSLATVNRWLNKRTSKGEPRKPLPLHQKRIEEILNVYREEKQNQEKANTSAA